MTKYVYWVMGANGVGHRWTLGVNADTPAGAVAEAAAQLPDIGEPKMDALAERGDRFPFIGYEIRVWCASSSSGNTLIVAEEDEYAAAVKADPKQAWRAGQ